MDSGGAGRTLAVVGHGFIGGRIVQAALSHGWKVRSLGRRARDVRVEPSHEMQVGDARHVDELARLLEGADHVVFSAGTAKPAESNTHPMHEIAANLGPLVATLEGMRRASVPALTLLSSGGTVYGPDAPTPTPETAPCGRSAPTAYSRWRPSAMSGSSPASTTWLPTSCAVPTSTGPASRPTGPKA